MNFIFAGCPIKPVKKGQLRDDSKEGIKRRRPSGTGGMCYITSHLVRYGVL